MANCVNTREKVSSIAEVVMANELAVSASETINAFPRRQRDARDGQVVLHEG
jgi:hypothetical protein